VRGKSVNHKEVGDLLIDGREGTVQIAHAREVAALLESLGYNDRSAKEWVSRISFP